ncbi:Uncharacterised protein g8519 [Pycnogonum litorale]
MDDGSEEESRARAIRDVEANSIDGSAESLATSERRTRRKRPRVKLSHHESFGRDGKRRLKSIRRDSIRSDVGCVRFDDDDVVVVKLRRDVADPRRTKKRRRQRHSSSVDASKLDSRRKIVMTVACVAFTLIFASVVLVAIMIIYSPRIDEIVRKENADLLKSMKFAPNKKENVSRAAPVLASKMTPVVVDPPT